MKEKSFETKRLAVEAYESGSDVKDLARIFQVHFRTVFRWVASIRAGKKENTPRGHRSRGVSPEDEALLCELISKKPDMTL